MTSQTTPQPRAGQIGQSCAQTTASDFVWASFTSADAVVVDVVDGEDGDVCRDEK